MKAHAQPDESWPSSDPAIAHPIKVWTTCRACGSADLTPLYSLGEQYVSNFVDTPDAEGILCPIELELCRECTLVQLKHTAPQEILYARKYWYRSGVTNSMRHALREVAEEAERRIDLRYGDVVLDIGSNDGTLLRAYQSKEIVTVGVEPADNLAEEGAKGVDEFIGDFWSAAAYWNRLDRPAKVITALGMFYDLDDPNSFIGDVAEVLAEDGLFIAQLMCLRNMVDLNDVGNLCHEHLEFYSLQSLHLLFARHGLEIFDIETVPVNGQSYRLYVRHIGSRVHRSPGSWGRLNAARDRETGLDDPAFHACYFARWEENKRKIVSYVKSAVADGKRVWILGASTKGNTLLQFWGLDHTLIEGASERSPEKWGKYTVGTGIKIHSEADARQAKPDVFLILPYTFAREITDRERPWLMAGGTFLVPLPNPYLLRMKDGFLNKELL